jgi:peptidoglycan/xylan/chitin deacetylase (PgdA/CDA1 family)
MHDRYHEIALIEEFDRWRAAGRIARLWLRDDDACQPGPSLDMLLEKLRRHQAPCLLAVIPMTAGQALADRLAGETTVRIAVHGAWHINHAPAGRKSEETPVERGLDAIVAELGAARERLARLFGEAATGWYVPPWNRIGAQVAARLPELGFRVLSTFARPLPDLDASLVQVNTHVDLVDWKGGRAGRPAAAVMADLASELAQARLGGWRPVGVLTHHLVHDARAWEALDALLELVANHPATRWSDPFSLVAESRTVADKSKLILRDDFEGDSFSPASGLFYKDNEEQRAGTFRFQSEIVRSGARALELTVTPQCRSSQEGFSERAEVWEHASVRAAYEQSVWYAFSMKLDDPPPSAAHRNMVAQWKRAINPNAEGDYSPFLGIRIIRGEFAITIDSDVMPTRPRVPGEEDFSCSGAPAPAMQRKRAKQTRLLIATSADGQAKGLEGFDSCAPDVLLTRRGGKLPKADSRWIDFVFKVKPGPRGDGEIEIFANGQWIASAAGRIGHEGPELGQTQYFKFGPYRDGGQKDRWRVFYDNFARGPNCEDVANPAICRLLKGV